LRKVHAMRVFAGTCLLAFASIVLLPGDEPSWKQKPVLQWDDQDAKLLLADSPWVKNVKLQRVRYMSEFERRDSGNWEAGIVARNGSRSTWLRYWGCSAPITRLWCTSFPVA
jgi:hypothetical protein